MAHIPTIPACVLLLSFQAEAQSLLELDARDEFGAVDSAAYQDSVHVLDFDGDGKLDLLFGGQLNYTIPASPLLRGLGEGRFERSSTFRFFDSQQIAWVADLDGNGTFEFQGDNGIWTIATNGSPSRLALPGITGQLCGDLDQDGDLDLVRIAGGRVDVLMQNGVLQFTVVHSVPFAGTLMSLCLGDINGDAFPDVLATARSGPIQLFENDGTGRLLDVSSRIGVTAGASSTCGLHDLDGDGRDEVLELSTGGGGIRVFSPRSGTYADISAQVPVPAGAHVGFAVGDIDGDRAPDLLIADVGGGLVLRNTASGWFVPLAGGWPGSNDHLSVALIDIDADGDLDLVETGHVLDSRLHFNDGTGRFVSPGTDRQVFPRSGAPGRQYVIAADVDRDTYVDLLTPDAFWQNDGFGRFSPLPSRAPDNTSGMPEAVAFGRLDPWYGAEIVVPTAFDRFRVYHGDSNGQFTPGTEYTAPITTQGGPLPSAPQHIAVLALHDLDQDGDLDLLCGAHPRNWTVAAAPAQDTIWWNDGTGHLTEDRNWCVTGEQFGKSVAFGDLNGDGRVDFTDGRGSFLQRPDHRFDYVGPDPNGWLDTGTVGPVALADLDGDGDLDCVEANACKGVPYCEGEPDVIGWNDGTGRFLRASLVEEQNSFGLALFDVDEDGDIDIFFGREQGGIHLQGFNRLLINEGNQVFRPADLGDEIPDVWRTTLQVVQGDFDTDGDIDLFTLDVSDSGTFHQGALWLSTVRHLRAPDLLRIGRSFRLELHGAKLGGAIYGSPGLGRTWLFPVGLLGLDPGSTALVASFGPSPTRQVDLDLVVPAEPALIGARYAFQGLVVDRSGTVRLTNRLVERFVGG
jgi:hypothetical protein